MDGDPAISVIVDAYSKGIRGFDIQKAYSACRQTAAGRGNDTNRPGNQFYMKQGYVPGEVSWTLDNTYYDWCVANFASSLGKTEDAQIFSRRAANYQNIYDPAVRSMRAKDSGGKWIPWKGRTEFGQGCTESNPGQQTWFVPHDVNGSISLMEKEAFTARLNEFFENTPRTFGWNAYYNHSNEQVHHVPYLVYAGKPWLTQKWVRLILADAYHNDVNGIVGNDDVGQMSAWYVLSAMASTPFFRATTRTLWGALCFRELRFGWIEAGTRAALSPSSPRSWRILTTTYRALGSTGRHSPELGSLTTKSLRAGHWNSSWARHPTMSGQRTSKMLLLP